MKTHEEIRERLKVIIGEVIDEEMEMDEKSSLMDDIGMNSIQVLTFIALVEREFGFEFGARDISELETFGEVVAYVQRNQK